MLFILGVMTCLLLSIAGLLVALYFKLNQLTFISTNQQAAEYSMAVNTPKTRPSRETIFAPKAKKAENSRAVNNQNQYVDLSEVNEDIGITALENYAEGN